MHTALPTSEKNEWKAKAKLAKERYEQEMKDRSSTTEPTNDQKVALAPKRKAASVAPDRGTIASKPVKQSRSVSEHLFTNSVPLPSLCKLRAMEHLDIMYLETCASVIASLLLFSSLKREIGKNAKNSL